MFELNSLSFHHFGLALVTEDRAIKFLSGIGYDCGSLVYDPEQDVHLRICSSLTKPAVEIVLPGKSENGPLTSILSKYDEIVYHICFETEDVDLTLQELKNRHIRYMKIGERKPAILFGGRYVSFFKIAGFGLIELLDTNV